MKSGIIGYPAAHSLSPLIHGYWLGKYGIEGSYDIIRTKPEELAATIARMDVENYTGASVTIPHKQEVMKLCGVLEESAIKVGAVNTLVFDKKAGELRGFNTDAFGFCESLRESAADSDFTRAPALVLGAGGASRAVVYGLLSLGVPEVRIVNRTRENAEALARDFPRTAVHNWEEREHAAKACFLVVNTTSLGMVGNPELGFDFSAAHLAKDAVICDIVYKPLFTELLLAARANGYKTVTGIGMLLHQARPAFKAWCGVMPEVTDELRKLVSEAAAKVGK
jgi:shikimate dehydrogenase